jgi:sulfatase maturation enzyme AslB (radical SAM superfamily)
VINQRLFDWYGIDTEKNLNIGKRCPLPFDTVLIDKQGSCYLCECTAWLPQSVGNLNTQSLTEILHNDMAHTLQSSIIDGSYRYCNNKQCAYLLDYKGTDPWSNTVPDNRIKHIRLAIDDSCNLSCPSCRKQKIFLKGGKMFDLRLRMVDKIIDFLKDQTHTIQVHIGSDGDPFASLIYRRFMMKTQGMKHLRYSIQTNGLLLKKNFHKFKHITDNLNRIGISIDGATKHTYEKLRRGGVFEMLLENLEFLKSIKTFHIHLHFVVQKENYQEIEQLIELGIKYGVDKIFLDRITDWNTMINFKEHAVADSDHPQNRALKKIIEKISNIDYGIRDFVEYRTLL